MWALCQLFVATRLRTPPSFRLVSLCSRTFAVLPLFGNCLLVCPQTCFFSNCPLETRCVPNLCPPTWIHILLSLLSFTTLRPISCVGPFSLFLFFPGSNRCPCSRSTSSFFLTLYFYSFCLLTSRIPPRPQCSQREGPRTLRVDPFPS